MISIKKEVQFADSVFKVHSDIIKLEQKELGRKHQACIVEAEKSSDLDNDYIKRRDNGLLDRKIWGCIDQISLYDGSKCNGKVGEYYIYYEQDKHNNPKEEQFEHMLDLTFKDLETATMVFKVLSVACPILMSYKIETI